MSHLRFDNPQIWSWPMYCTQQERIAQGEGKIS